ncbi:fused response regulator/phosphatase [Allorhodopirellula heiligendammensis]|uniref:Phosphoserine phosphatase RsbU n=1 Tax=Allorhodopirellula heiligendammensis TaxID=2714739 RepID=A0A5C6C1C5_9BACT|nr:fused response regulator/phosphatase [Allorhodopirellula heiligendammensis]TWU18373.1 Phosphoserine phosphatase RsbU [Allorhodopirellula heiligendammensis]
MNHALPIVILLVEDSPTARFHVQVCLKKGLQNSYSLLQAENLAVAISTLRKNSVDIVLLDLNLPDSNGLDTFRRLAHISAGAAIVIISGDTDEQMAVNAVRLGAQDYIVKGAGFTAEVLGRTVHFAIERNARHLLEKELASVRLDLEIADTIQQRLYPRSESKFPNVSLAGRCSSATHNCGDYYDYITRPDGSLLVVIGDVSGHGIGPAMMMVETRAFLRALASSSMPLGEILTHINRLIADDMQQQLFVTLFVASLDASGQQLSYSSAGHPGYLVKPDGRVVTLQTDNTPLGISPLETYPTASVSEFAPGDLLALFTDGISEATHDHQDFLGEQRVLDEVVSGRELPAPAILESMFTLAERFNGTATQQDDRTAVVVKTAAKPI